MGRPCSTCPIQHGAGGDGLDTCYHREDEHDNVNLGGHMVPIMRSGVDLPPMTTRRSHGISRICAASQIFFLAGIQSPCTSIG